MLRGGHECQGDCKRAQGLCCLPKRPDITSTSTLMVQTLPLTEESSASDCARRSQKQGSQYQHKATRTAALFAQLPFCEKQSKQFHCGSIPNAPQSGVQVAAYVYLPSAFPAAYLHFMAFDSCFAQAGAIHYGNLGLLRKLISQCCDETLYLGTDSATACSTRSPSVSNMNWSQTTQAKSIRASCSSKFFVAVRPSVVAAGTLKLGLSA